MARAREVLFRIFYSTSFTVVFLILVSFICITPADAIYQSYRRNRLTDIFILAGAYVLTALIAAFLYSSRLYTNRSVLKDIPKTFIPIDKEELPGRRVKKLIDECLARSAVVAYQAKPRSHRIEVEVPNAGSRILALTKSKAEDPLEPRWGKVAHPGWSSPESKELPNLQYETVVDELVALVEAKAVSLAPIDPLSTPPEDGIPMPDQRAVELLSRPEAMGMRQYLTYLIELGVVPQTELSAAFLTAYERARFGAEPLSQTNFQILMRLFAELLRSMTAIPIDLLEFSDDEDNDPSPIARDSSSTKSKSTFSASASDSGSVRRNPTHLSVKSPPRRVSEDSVPSMMSEDDEFHEFPARSAPNIITTAASSRSVSKRPAAGPREISSSSRPSLRQTKSNMSGVSSRTSRSNGSVLRLTAPGEESDLPYTIQLPPSRRAS